MVIEWAPFTLKPGVPESALLAASEDLQRDFLAHQPGFVRRELMQDGGQWTDLICWENREAVERAMMAVADSPVCHRYFALMAGIDHTEAGKGVAVYEIRASYHLVPVSA